MPCELTLPFNSSEGSRKKVFLVDQHPVYRLGLLALIEAEKDLVICGVAGNAISALDALRGTEADAVVLEILLPGPDGLELLKGIKVERPELPVLVLSVFDERSHASRCLRSGAAGYLMKTEADAPTFVRALRKVLGGEIFLSEAFEAQIVRCSIRGGVVMAETPLGLLSDRELEILHHIGNGEGTVQIGKLLHLSTKTVESHRLHIKEKLRLSDASALPRIAAQWVEWQHFGGTLPSECSAAQATRPCKILPYDFARFASAESGEEATGHVHLLHA